MNLALSKLKRNTNYEAPTTCLNIAWVGGYDSAQMLNAKELCVQRWGQRLVLLQIVLIQIILLRQSKQKKVCIAVAAEFETRRAIYKMKKRTRALYNN